MALHDYRQILISGEDTLRRAIEIIDASAIQIVLVVDEAGRLQGTVTDGDIRRGILRGVGLDEAVRKVMNPHPITAPVGIPPAELLALMTSRQVKHVPLVDNLGRVIGLELLDNLHRSPAIKENPVVIVAGGQGMRLRPLTSETPKPLLHIGGQPVLELILRQFQAYGFRRLFISVNYRGGQIEEYFGDGARHGMAIQYLREPSPLGTAGCLSLLPKPLGLPCIVVNGDLLTKVNFQQMLEFHRETGFHLTIGVKEHHLEIPFGVVVTQGERVVEFREKPAEIRLINAGVYVVEPDLLDMVPHGAYYDMTDLIEETIGQPQWRVGAFPIHEYWIDIGTFADYRRAQGEFPAHFGP